MFIVSGFASLVINGIIEIMRVWDLVIAFQGSDKQSYRSPKEDYS